MPDIRTGTFNCKGLSDLEKTLTGLSDKIAKNVMLGAVRAGAVVVQREAKNLCPQSAESHFLGKGSKRVEIQPGELKAKGIKVRKAKRGTSDFALSYQVYVSRRYWYWKFVEFGHVIARKRRNRWQKRNDAGHQGYVAAKPFMRPAFDAQKQAAVDAIRDYAAKRIEKEVAKRGN